MLRGTSVAFLPVAEVTARFEPAGHAVSFGVGIPRTESSSSLEWSLMACSALCHPGLVVLQLLMAGTGLRLKI